MQNEETIDKRNPRTLQQWHVYRRENPRRFYEPKAQQLMLSDRMELGEKFYERQRTKDDA